MKACSLAASNQAATSNIKRKGLDLVLEKLLFFSLLLYPLSATATFCTRRTDKNAVWSRAEWRACATCWGAAGEWSTSLAGQNIRRAGCREEMSLYWSITSVLFCFLLTPRYSLIQAHVWGALGTVTVQQAEAADANEDGREKHTFKWEKNLAQCHFLILCNQG